MVAKRKCAVCGNLIDDYPCEICPVCDWERDDYQEACPNIDGCANKLSLNQARQIWQEKNKTKTA